MENLFSCPVCNKEFTTWNGLAKHTSRNHDLSGKELVMKYYKMLEIPKCKCGAVPRALPVEPTVPSV